jgi:hypothetical protein
MAIEWERILDGVPKDLRALDGEEIVGRVYQLPHGPQGDLWFWTMTAFRPGPRPAHATNVRSDIGYAIQWPIWFLHADVCT